MGQHLAPEEDGLQSIQPHDRESQIRSSGVVCYNYIILCLLYQLIPSTLKA